MCLLKRIKKNREQKRLSKENDMMFSAAINMLGCRFDQEEFESCITPFTKEEIDSLIGNIKTSPFELPGSKYVIHSIEKHPSRVFHINCLSLIQDKEPEELEYRSSTIRQIPKGMAHSHQVLFLYDDFGFPETYLAARAGYSIYDEKVNQVIAHWWPMMS